MKNVGRGIFLIGFLLLCFTACATGSPPSSSGTPDSLTGASGPYSLLPGLMAQVTPNGLSNIVGDLSGEWPILVDGETVTITSRVQLDGDAILPALQYVFAHMQNTGLEPYYFDWQLPAGPITRGRDIVATLPGNVHPDEIVLMTAHVDDMVNRDVDSAGSAHPRPPIPVIDPLWMHQPAPGADDNASGTAGVLLTARILSGHRFERTIRFVFFTGEENGYLGSFSYARAMRAAGENIVAVYNLDMLGYDGAGGPVVDIDLRTAMDSPQDGALADIFTEVVRANGIDLIPERQYQSGIYVGSDHGMFWAQGYPAIDIMENHSGDFNPYYHSQYDRLEHLNMTYYTNVIKAALGAVAYSAGPLDPAPDN
jgi:hypothetical protein